MQDSNFEIINLQFEDIKPPSYKENKVKGWVTYGEQNDYPNYLLGLFNDSAKHAAIVRGKADYIRGNGFAFKQKDQASTNSKTQTIIDKANADGESLSDVLGKAAFDVELFGGAYLEIHFNKKKQVSEIYHLDFSNVRTNKAKTLFYFSEEWHKESGTSLIQNSQVKPEEIPAFDKENPKGKQVLFIEQYTPGKRIYPLPGYFGCMRYIQVDINIAEFHLNGTNNGMFTSKIINFNNGVPSLEDQDKIEKKVNKKFAGTKNAGKIMLSFNKSKDNAPTVDDLSATELDKHFDILNKTVQQELYSGHRITSPMLFGIKTEGQLGGRAELQEASELFENTYVNSKREFFEKHINNILEINGLPPVYLQKSEPIGYAISQTAIDASLTEDEKRERLGLKPKEVDNENGTEKLVKAINGLSPLVANKVLASMTNNEIRSIAGLPGVAGGDVIPVIAPAIGAPGTTPAAFESNLNDDLDILVFEKFGKKKSSYEILSTSQVFFRNHQQFNRHYFATVKELSAIQQSVIDLLSKDSRLPVFAIAKALDISEVAVTALLKDLRVQNLIKVDTEVTTSGEEIEVREPTADAKDLIGNGGSEKTSIKVMYSYEGPEDSRNRPFCAKLVSMNVLFTRLEIEEISAELGYSVFHRRGGWYTDPVTNKPRPYCRHHWASNTVIEKS